LVPSGLVAYSIRQFSNFEEAAKSAKKDAKTVHDNLVSTTKAAKDIGDLQNSIKKQAENISKLKIDLNVGLSNAQEASASNNSQIGKVLSVVTIKPASGRSGVPSAQDRIIEQGKTRALGIDVSQGDNPNWKSVKDSGASFVFIRATRTTEMGTEADPDFAKKWQGSGAAGIIRGAYHVYRWIADPEEQAAAFAKTVTLNGEDLPPALDIEPLPPAYAPIDMNDPKFTKALTACLHAFAAETHRTPIIF
jgi:Glycosyl hydrolases family 25